MHTHMYAPARRADIVKHKQARFRSFKGSRNDLKAAKDHSNKHCGQVSPYALRECSRYLLWEVFHGGYRLTCTMLAAIGQLMSNSGLFLEFNQNIYNRFNVTLQYKKYQSTSCVSIDKLSGNDARILRKGCDSWLLGGEGGEHFLGKMDSNIRANVDRTIALFSQITEAISVKYYDQNDIELGKLWKKIREFQILLKAFFGERFLTRYVNLLPTQLLLSIHMARQLNVPFADFCSLERTERSHPMRRFVFR